MWRARAARGRDRRRARGELRFAPGRRPARRARRGAGRVDGPLELLDARVERRRRCAPRRYPDALARVWAACSCPTAGRRAALGRSRLRVHRLGRGRPRRRRQPRLAAPRRLARRRWSSAASRRRMPTAVVDRRRRADGRGAISGPDGLTAPPLARSSRCGVALACLRWLALRPPPRRAPPASAPPSDRRHGRAPPTRCDRRSPSAASAGRRRRRRRRPRTAIADRSPRRSQAAPRAPRRLLQRLREVRPALAGQLLLSTIRPTRRSRRSTSATTRAGSPRRGPGPQVAWTMARGYAGAFGRKINSPWVWIPLMLLFVVAVRRSAPPVPGAPPRPARARRLLASASPSSTTRTSTPRSRSSTRCWPTCSARMLWIGLRRGRAARAAAPPRARRVAAIGLLFLVGVSHRAEHRRLERDRRRLRRRHRRGPAGARRPAVGDFPKDNEHGDTYGPVAYAAYVPVRARPGRGAARWDDLPAAHAAAIFFDLLVHGAAVPHRPAHARPAARASRWPTRGRRTRSRSTRWTATSTTRSSAALVLGAHRWPRRRPRAAAR